MEQENKIIRDEKGRFTKGTRFVIRGSFEERFGKEKSVLIRKKMSDTTKKGYDEGITKKLVGEDHPMYGTQRSEKVRKKISEGNKLNLDEKKIIEMYTKENISSTKIAKKFTCSTKPICRILRENNIKIKGASYFNKGKHLSEGTRKKMSENNARPFEGQHHTEETRKKLCELQTGNHPTEETIEKMSTAKIGEKNVMWQGGISKEPYDQNWTPKFRRAVRKRDNQVCMLCGIHREKLNRALSVHHINHDKKMSLLQNGISLCSPCHNGIVHKDDKNEEEKENWIKLLQRKLAKLYSYQYSEINEIILELNK